MNSNQPIRVACSEEFAELCALSTTGALTADEQLRLNRHLSGCCACTDLLADYRGLAVEGAAKMVGVSDADWEHPNYPWDEEGVKNKLLSTLGTADAERHATKTIAFETPKSGHVFAFRFVPALGAAAMI